jgi:hypothetical protein
MTRRGVLAEIRQVVGWIGEENPTWGYNPKQNRIGKAIADALEPVERAGGPGPRWG